MFFSGLQRRRWNCLGHARNCRYGTRRIESNVKPPSVFLVEKCLYIFATPINPSCSRRCHASSAPDSCVSSLISYSDYLNEKGVEFSLPENPVNSTSALVACGCLVIAMVFLFRVELGVVDRLAAPYGQEDNFSDLR